jgi:hypothetical protein
MPERGARAPGAARFRALLGAWLLATLLSGKYGRRA